MADKGEDRISELPDCILLIILSFLGSTKDVFTTSLVSKRWQFLWLHVPEIDLFLEEDNFWRGEGKRQSFVNFVTKMLSMRSETETHLNKFVVYFYFLQCFTDKVNQWVDFTIENSVENIKLMFDYGRHGNYLLPQRFYVNSSVTSLSLRSCDMVPQVAIKWECLNSLFLNGVSLTPRVVENILSGCPVLEVLSISQCNFPDNSWEFSRTEVEHYNLNISLPSLTTFETDSWGDIVCEISAPYVINLSLYSWIRSFSLKNVSSVVRADLSLNPEYCQEIFESLKFVEELEFGTWFDYRNQIKIPQFTQLRCLTLNVDDGKKSIPGTIAAFLGSAPNLETLFINGGNTADHYNNWDASMDFILSHLKTVKITDFIRDATGEPMLTLVQILLDKAEILEKIVISATTRKSRFSSIDLSEICSEISDKLYSFPRASDEAIIEFDIKPLCLLD